MPLYYFKCPECGEAVKKLLTPDAAESYVGLCVHDGKQLVRDPRGFSAQTMEVLDNGYMPKKLERLADAERIYKDHADSKDEQ